MSVILIRKKAYLAYLSNINDKASTDGVKFIAGSVVTLLVPIIFFCVVVGEIWPFLLMGSDYLLGAIIGFLMFKRSSGAILSCVPLTSAPNVLGSASLTGLKLAA
jgi:hypothetical protein